MKCTGARATVGLLMVAMLTAAPLSAQAQTKGHSDRSVLILMEYTWSTTPAQFRHPNGELITIDKTKKKENMVPLDKAREIVVVAERSAKAQYCTMAEEQDANFQTLMRREIVSNKWTKAQIVYITLLHATTVAYLTGNVKFQFGAEGEKDVEIVNKGPVWTEPCTDTAREKIRQQIMTYINDAPANEPATKRAEPSTGTQKK
jgi:hypothetical protein